jgi:hypothetical protein
VDSERNEVDVLLARAGRGDPAAVAQLRQQLEPDLARIVRRALKGGGMKTVSRLVLAEAGRVVRDPRGQSPGGCEELARQVAGRLCEAVLAGLRARPAGGQALQETVRC